MGDFNGPSEDSPLIFIDKNWFINDIESIENINGSIEVTNGKTFVKFDRFKNLF